jgi:hypothetical protein
LLSWQSVSLCCVIAACVPSQNAALDGNSAIQHNFAAMAQFITKLLDLPAHCQATS